MVTDAINSDILDNPPEAVANAHARAVHVILGACGNKLLAVAEGRADVAIMHFGTSLWDTCAPEAIVRAAGGRVTDLFGAQLSYNTSSTSGLVNTRGVLATSASFTKRDAAMRVGDLGERGGRTHDSLTASMRATPAVATLLNGRQSR